VGWSFSGGISRLVFRTFCLLATATITTSIGGDG